MSRARWHIHHDGATLILSRQRPARFDVSATTRLPDAGRVRVAHQVRQDMWRALQSLRGFSPCVAVTRDEDGLQVRAGGRVAGICAAPRVEQQIAAVLEDPQNRARWVRHAGGRA